MVYGAINEKGEPYYTDLKKVFDSIGNRQTEYNWLITDCVCYPNNPKTDAMLSKQYCWISGEDLTSLVYAEDFQWIWAVLCGFDKTIALSEILEYSLPYADGYKGFWKTPLTMQHPLAKIEIVLWDSSLTLIFSRSKDIIDDFMQNHPQSENLEDYIGRL
ncbi:hypothetical protein WMO64_05340 [Pseudoflavonifractor sp. CLA-AP-H29]|uniref:DUF2691 family protein n=1 Tax=Pseudoflavonifractor intestinihominis TaxID=3133171 RepID=A0ABV1E8X2_9FIRM